MHIINMKKLLMHEEINAAVDSIQIKPCFQI